MTSKMGTAAVVVGVSLGLLASCSDDTAKSKVQDLEQRLRAVVSERKALRRQLAETLKERDALRQELDKLELNALISDEHAFFDTALRYDEQQDLHQAVRWYEYFLDHYPKSPMAKKAKKRLKVLKKASAAMAEKQRAREAAAQLQDATVADIFANIRKYKGATLERSVKCSEIGEELFRPGRFSSLCALAHDASGDLSVRYKEADVKLLAELKRDYVGRVAYKGLFEVRDRGISGDVVVKFLELVER